LYGIVGSSIASLYGIFEAPTVPKRSQEASDRFGLQKWVHVCSTDSDTSMWWQQLSMFQIEPQKFILQSAHLLYLVQEETHSPPTAKATLGASTTTSEQAATRLWCSAGVNFVTAGRGHSKNRSSSFAVTSFRFLCPGRMK
jgi:hypothetical protein